MKNGMRQPQARSSASSRNCCRIDEHQRGEELAADQGDVLEGREEAAAAVLGDLGHVGGHGAVFAPDREALDQPRDEEQRRREEADLAVGRQHRDEERAAAHHEHGDHHREAPSPLVGEPAEEPAPDRAHEKAGGEHAGGGQELGGLVALGEELGREVERGEGVDVEVVPLHEVAGGAGDDGAHAPHRVVTLRVRRVGGVGEGGHRFAANKIRAR
jgi:hypothetical protein